MRPDVLSCAAGCRLSTASRRYVRCSRLSPTGALCPPPPAPLQLHRPAAAGSETHTVRNTRRIDSNGITLFSYLLTCGRLTTLRMKHFCPTCLVGAVLSVRWSLCGAPPGRLPGSQTAGGDLPAGKLVEQAARQATTCQAAGQGGPGKNKLSTISTGQRWRRTANVGEGRPTLVF